MICEIICVGTELLTGKTINTNASYIAKKMMMLGINMYHQTVVGDNTKRLTEAVKRAVDRSDLVITCGGLGSTYDDMTKETVCKALGKDFVLNKEVEKELHEYFKRQNRVMPKSNIKQAYMPSDATPIPNENGTACGIIIPLCDNKQLIMVPGPPKEMKPMIDNTVVPMLMKKSGFVILGRSLNTLGLGESALAEKIRDLSVSSQNPTVATYVKDMQVDIRITAKAESEEKATALLDEYEEKVRKSVPQEYIFGVDYDNIEERLVEVLKEKGLKIASAESCTGGFISKRITDISGASSVFECGICSYGCNIKEKLLGVDTISEYGAVSRETAAEMAQGVLELSGADIAVSTTGNAGPDVMEGKAVGLVYIGVATKNKTETFEYSLALGRGNQRNNVRTNASTMALYNAYKAALKL